MAPPGKYTVVMTAGDAKVSQPLEIVEDPRVLASGVTNADLAAQFEHNMRVLALVNDTNLAVARIKKAQTDLKATPDAAKAKAIQPIADALITPPIRYSAPGLESHVSYLYGETNSSDQKVGRDAIERYAELRQKVDGLIAELDKVLGPVTTADAGLATSGELE
jgi:hypothetical protein